MAATAIPSDRVEARRIGLVADTHSARPDGSDLPQAVLEARPPGTVAIVDPTGVRPRAEIREVASRT